MDAKALLSVLGVWSRGNGSLQRKLTEALMEAVREGGLAPGVRLPSERRLAEALSVSRTTVVAAYDALRDAGWFESRSGSGTWVRTGSTTISMARSAARTAALTASPLLGLLVDRDADDIVDLGLGSPLPLPAGDLDAEAFALSKDEYDALMRERVHYPLGLPMLRAAVAEHYTREGLPTGHDQVLITNGAQQAIALCAALFLQRGDVALIEDPAYFGAVAAFRAAGARLSTVPVMAAGVAPSTLRDRLRATPARLLYLTPSCQNPTGAVSSTAAGKEIVRIVTEAGMPTIDDRTMADLVLEAAPAVALAAHSPSAPILTIGSLSKLITPSLRIGWIRAAEPFIQRLARLKTAMDLGSPLIVQAVAAQLVALTAKARTLRQRELKSRRDHMVSSLRAEIPEWTFSVPAAGLFLWVRLPSGDARAFAQVAVRHGVVIIPGPDMSADEQHAAFVRMTFLWDRDTLTRGVNRLRAAWRQYLTMKARLSDHVVMI